MKGSTRFFLSDSWVHFILRWKTCKVEKGNTEMMIIQFWQDLGSQMFEYALYKKMLQIYPTRAAVLAHFEYENDEFGYALEKAFGIKLMFSSLGQVAKLSNFYPRKGKKAWFYRKVFDLRSRFLGDKASYFQQDYWTEYYPEVFELSTLRAHYLRGIWANEKYFRDIKDELLQDFVFQISTPDGDNTALIQEMENVNAVSIHVRSHPDDVNVGRDFYEQAIKIIKSKVPDPRFYVFAYNLDKAKQILDGLLEYRLIEHNRGEKNYLDMMLMSRCKHNIIANSTFSFWGAYLNTYPDKIVIGPDFSVKDEKHAFSCEEWINIPCKRWENI